MCHSGATWYQSLPTVLLGLRTTIHEDLKATSAESVFGENLRLPGNFLHDSKLASPSPFVQQHNTFADLPILRRTITCDQAICKVFDIIIKSVSRERTISFDRLKPCFFADPDPAKPTSVDKSSTTSTAPSIVPATPHHLQQGTSEQSSKLRVRFAEPPAQYVTRSGCAVHPSRRFL
ncbi:hypothetical protein TNIN_228801 [Trichonephila inaurata madagascariensis]|uniref:Uncharacterized protein n=1 Tax=Trichonephila inaurata madagascariensis TaxID=2747483 RepID=A0A8X6MGE5_9ARAC|nr:hypothetical protein TNIN_228801 [Trichonephila inaurata madagascariensis]